MAKSASEEAFLEILKAIGYFFAVILTAIGFVVETLVSAARGLIAENKKAAETRALEAHYETNEVFQANVALSAAAGYPKLEDFMEGLYARFCQDIEDNKTRFPHYEIRAALITAAGNLYQAEGLHRPPEQPPANADKIQQAIYRDKMLARAKKAGNPDTIKAIDQLLRESIEGFIRHLPDTAIDLAEDDDGTPAAASIALLSALPDIGAALDDLVLPLFAPKAIELDLFSDTRARIQAKGDALGIAKPSDYKGTDPVNDIVGGTVLAPIFAARFPFSLPTEQRYAGHWIIAPPGRGKTTLLHSLVVGDLAKDASVVLMDSKGDLIEPIKNLQSLKDRLVLIEPSPETAFALNPLDVSHASIVQVVSLIEYIMAGLLDAKFTALQSTLFRNVVPAIIEAIPSPTLDDFKQVMVKGLPALDKVNPHARDFFENRDTGFYSKTYESTRKEVVWRLDYLLSNPTLRSMFSATHTKLDFGKQMDAGRVIIINNSKAILGDEGAEFFGRFFVALIARAAQQRAGKPPATKKPCYVYIDECQSVIAKDTRIPILLDECRSQKIALILAHQRTAQLTAPVLDAVANCAIRMANSDDEAKFLSDKLRMSADMLRSLPRGTFGTFVRDLTPAGIQLQVAKIDLDALLKMTDEETAAVRERMRAFSSAPPENKTEPPAADFSPPIPSGPPVRPASEDPGEPAADWA